MGTIKRRWQARDLDEELSDVKVQTSKIFQVISVDSPTSVIPALVHNWALAKQL